MGLPGSSSCPFQPPAPCLGRRKASWGLPSVPVRCEANDLALLNLGFHFCKTEIIIVSLRVLGEQRDAVCKAKLLVGTCWLGTTSLLLFLL